MDSDITKKEKLRIGIISDTHGLLRPEAAEALQGSDVIIHAGDIGPEELLDELRAIAPVVAVRGNMDTDYWSDRLKRMDVVELASGLCCVIHDLGNFNLSPHAADCRVVISGHSHRAAISTSNDVLYINPGSAGPRRFRLPVSVALLDINGKKMKARIIELNV